MMDWKRVLAVLVGDKHEWQVAASCVVQLVELANILASIMLWLGATSMTSRAYFV